MATDLIITASTILTMEDAHARAEAIAIDTSTGTITAIGTLAEVQAAAPGVGVTDLGDTVLMPGFIDAHSHPLLSGMLTQDPAYWMAPYVGYPTYTDVHRLFTKVNAELPGNQPAVFAGLDRLL